MDPADLAAAAGPAAEPADPAETEAEMDHSELQTLSAASGAESAADLADPAEVAAELTYDAPQDRLWLRAILPLIQARSAEPDPSVRVQFAHDQMHIAACERAARIMRSDLAAGQGG